MKASAALLAAALTGCASIGTTEFDPVEYNQWITVGYMANVISTQCGTDMTKLQVNVLEERIKLAHLYSTTKAFNPRIGQATKILEDQAVEFSARYQNNAVPSTTYCQQKALGISQAALVIAKSLSKKEL